METIIFIQYSKSDDLAIITINIFGIKNVEFDDG